MNFEYVTSRAIFSLTLLAAIIGWVIGKRFPDETVASLVAIAVYLRLEGK
jgi:hypothetical protein